MQIRQLKTGGWNNFTYVIGCDVTHEALVIDPAKLTGQILAAAEEIKSNIRFIINTHGHHDHTSGNRLLKKATGASILMHTADAHDCTEVDRQIRGNEILQLGKLSIQIIHTPGHTPGGICLFIEGNLFTGDTLFVGDSGRTDLPGGDRRLLGASIRNLMLLDDQTIVWPGHDYGPTPHSTLAWEKLHNVNAKEYGFYKKI